jgi:hypothetical protein
MASFSSMSFGGGDIVVGGGEGGVGVKRGSWGDLMNGAGAGAGVETETVWLFRVL